MDFLKRLFGHAVSRVVQVKLSDEDFIAVLQAARVRTEISRHGSWRCGCCSKLQHAETVQAWIPDYTQRGDPMWAVLEKCRRMAYNGSYTAWCLACCRGLKPMTADEMARYDKTPHNPIPVIDLTVGQPMKGARPFVQGMTLGPGESAVMTIPLSVDAVDPVDGDSNG